MYCTMMKNLNCTKLIVALFALCFVACEKPVLNDDSSQENPTSEDLYHLTFRMSHYEQIPFEEGLEALALHQYYQDVYTHQFGNF